MNHKWLSLLILIHIQTVAVFSADVTVHVTTPFADLNDQNRRVYIFIPKLVLVLFLLLEVVTVDSEQPILAIEAAAQCAIPLGNATFLGQTTTFSMWTLLPTREFLQFSKVARVYALLRALLTDGTTTVFQFAVPFNKPRVGETNVDQF